MHTRPLLYASTRTPAKHKKYSCSCPCEQSTHSLGGEDTCAWACRLMQRGRTRKCTDAELVDCTISLLFGVVQGLDWTGKYDDTMPTWEATSKGQHEHPCVTLACIHAPSSCFASGCRCSCPCKCSVGRAPSNEQPRGQCLRKIIY